MRIAGGIWLLSGSLAWACAGPHLDLPEPLGTEVSVDFEPAVGEGSVPPLFRARLHDAPVSGTPWLFRGELSDYYARSLKQGDVPSALRERTVPLRFWREGSDCFVQPLEWLEPEGSYTLAVTGLGVVRTVQVRSGGERYTRRLFPPPGASKHQVAVICELAEDEVSSSLRLEPGGIAVQASPGMAGQPGSGCVTLQVQSTLTDAVVAPPLVGTTLFEPSAWFPSRGTTHEIPSPACQDGELFHGACLEVLDDRLRITPLSQDLFFTLDEPEPRVLSARVGSRRLLLRGLSPAKPLRLSGAVLASDGQQTTFRETMTTLPARRHLVINEVLANPAGPEPDSEWLELVNDSDVATSLSDVWLEDSAGSVRLPDVELASGEIALVVGGGFRASAVDVPVPGEVRLLRVPSLGARGLSNGGEALLLVGREGVLSRFPMLPAAHAGRSIARRALDGADDDVTEFAEHGGAGASPGAPNVLDD